VNTFKKESLEPQGIYQVMLKSLISDIVTDVVQCVAIRTLLAFVNTSHFMAVHNESLKRFLPFSESSSLVASSSPYNWL
jgi:hypothetical protein